MVWIIDSGIGINLSQKKNYNNINNITVFSRLVSLLQSKSLK